MLYFVESLDSKFAFVVRANHTWQARFRASDFVFENYDISISPSDFVKVIPLNCDEVIGE